MFWDTLRSDLQHAVRLAGKSPLITALTVIALALGIGANSAIFAVVDSVLREAAALCRRRPARERLERCDQAGPPAEHLVAGELQRLSEDEQDPRRPRGLLLLRHALQNHGDDGNSEIVVGVSVTPRLFDLLGRKPIIGRPMSDDDAQPETLISYGFWQRRFGGDPAIIGRTMQVPGAALTIVGVMPPDFTFPYGSMLGPSGFTRATTIDMWAPIRFAGPLATLNRMLTPQGQLVRGTHWLGAIGRMKPGVTVAEVQADMSVAARQMEQSYPDTNLGWGATVVPVIEQTVGTIRGPLLVLLAGVAFVLIIAAVNVANLVLARSIARQKELATRVALGAGRRRMIQQALTEGLLLAAAGGVAGLLLARWGVSALVQLAPADLPRLQDITPDARMLWITAGVSVLTGIFVGLLPAIAATRMAPHSALQENSRGTVGGAFRQRARAALVVAEVAMAVTLDHRRRAAPAELPVAHVGESGVRAREHVDVADEPAVAGAHAGRSRRVLHRVPRAHEGVARRGERRRHEPAPLGSTGLTTAINVEGRPAPVAEWPEVQFRRALGDYFQTMGIPVIRGRMFTEMDGPNAPPVCIVNQALAAKMFQGEDPVGRQIRNSETGPAWTIVALVGDVKHAALDEEPQPEMYVSTYQGSMMSPYVVLRTKGNAADMIDVVRAEARKIDKDLPIYSLQTMETVKSDSVAQRRFVLVLVGIFGVLALLLAAIGVYGVMSLLVSERTQEVGVRLALGAHPSHVLRMLVGQAVRLTLLGITVGVVLSAALMPLLANQLYAVKPRDPITLTGIPAVLLLVAIVAALDSRATRDAHRSRAGASIRVGSDHE